MSLQPQADTPGLWVNDGWTPGSPGSFAVVIGVSSYDHLPGGTGPQASNTYGLPPLYVSALTAHRFFVWLRDKYAYASMPISQCWLLLAPTDAELAFEPKLGEHLLRPTLDNCEQAIGHWFANMRDLARASSSQSRAFFFFSGHGLEITRDRQILLPCDYLRPPIYNVNRAISTDNLQAGMAALAVPDQFFFLDACRNDTLALRQMEDLEGARLLNVSRAIRNPTRNAPLFYASASGTQAWQPKEPAKGISLFGQALLEGLQTRRDFPRSHCKQGLCEVKVRTLEDFLTRRVTELLNDLSAQTQQIIPPIASRDVAIAQFKRRTHLAQPSVAEPPPGLPQVFQVDNPAAVAGLSLHDILGSERMTDIWQGGVKVWSLQRQEWLPDNQAYALHRVERDESTRVYRFVLSASGSGPHWLQLNDALTTFGCLLPAGDREPARYALDIVFEYDSHDEQGAFVSPRHISRISVSLDESNSGRLGKVAQVWRHYNGPTVPETLNDIHAGFAEETLRDKVEAPLAATVAALILLRHRRLDLMHNWVDNLARWFPEMPDRHVLRVERLLQEQGDPAQPVEAAKWLLELQARGLPQTADGLGYAVRQADELLQLLDDVAPEYIQLEQLQARLRQALRFFRSGGLCAVFAGPRDNTIVTPRLVQAGH